MQFATGLYDGWPQIVGIAQDHDLDARGRLELPDEVRCQLRRLTNRKTPGRTVGFFDIKPDATRDDVTMADHDGADRLMPPDVRLSRGVFPRGDGVPRLDPVGFLGVINDQGKRIALAGTEGTQQGLGLLAEDRLGIPPLDSKEIVEAGPVVLGI